MGKGQNNKFYEDCFQGKLVFIYGTSFISHFSKGSKREKQIHTWALVTSLAHKTGFNKLLYCILKIEKKAHAVDFHTRACVRGGE